MLGQNVTGISYEKTIFAETKIREMENGPELNLRETLQKWEEDTINTLRHNIVTQHVWPSLVYPRYDEINDIRRRYGSWYSTGNALETLRSVIKGDTISEISDARIDFFFNEYLRYVDIGVGKGRKAEDIDRTRKARYRSRYARKWDPKKGNTHRPSFMMEFRHLQRRMGWYLMTRFQYEGSAYLMSGFEDMLKDPEDESIE